MAKRSQIDQQGQTVQGPQINNAGDFKGQIFSGRFQIQGDFIYNEATKIRLPLMIPPRAQHFTGRVGELASLLKQLRPGRVVTICGPGGMGKTALSVEAIWQLAPGIEPPKRFPDGIIFHTFYHRPQAALSLEIIARAYGEEPRPNPYEAARRALAGRQALIVLDGAEACDDLDTVLSARASAAFWEACLWPYSWLAATWPTGGSLVASIWPGWKRRLWPLWTWENESIRAFLS